MSVSQIKNSPNIKKTSVTIDSVFRSSGTPTNFTYDLSTTIENVRMIEVGNIEFVNNGYNINQYQRHFNYTDTLGVTHQFTIANGTESISSLVRDLQSGINSSKTNGVQDFIVRFDDVDRILFSTVLGSTTFELNFSQNPNSTLAPLLGFGITDYTGSTQYISPNPINLNYTTNLYIGSTNLSQDLFDLTEVSNGASNVIRKIQVEKEFGEIIFIKEKIPIRTKIDSLSTIDITIKDDQNRDAEFENANFKITIDIYSRVFNNAYSL